MSYKVVIGVPINGIERYFELDTVSERDVESSMTIASQPIQDGRTVSDHAYRNPTEENLSGTFSVRGSWTIFGDCYTRKNIGIDEENASEFLAGEGAELKGIVDGGSRLQNIQIFWEWVMTQGLLVDIYMLMYDEKSKEYGSVPRFKVRENMALRRASWKERYDSMTYSFSFQEVQTVSVSKFEQFDVSLYPSTDMPETKTLGEVISDTNNVAKAVLEILLNGGYISPDDAKAYNKAFQIAQKSVGVTSSARVWGKAFTIALATLIGEVMTATQFAGVIAGGIAAGLITGASILSATGIGLAIGVAAFIVAGVAIGVSSIISEKKKKERAKQAFNLLIDYEQYFSNGELQVEKLANAQENIADVARLQKLLNEIETSVKNEFSNVQIYQISNSKTDNSDRSFAVNVGSDFVYGHLTRWYAGSTVKPQYRIALFDSPGNDAKSLPVYHQWSPVSDFSTASRDTNVVYIDSSGEYEMYLINPNKMLEAADETEDPLSDYALMVCKGNIADTWNRLQTTIIETMQNHEFEV